MGSLPRQPMLCCQPQIWRHQATSLSAREALSSPHIGQCLKRFPTRCNSSRLQCWAAQRPCMLQPTQRYSMSCQCWLSHAGHHSALQLLMLYISKYGHLCLTVVSIPAAKQACYQDALLHQNPDMACFQPSSMHSAGCVVTHHQHMMS